jgi:hypothetical protein
MRVEVKSIFRATLKSPFQKPLAWLGLCDSWGVMASPLLEELIGTMTAIIGKRGRPRRRPGKLHADKAYDHRRCRDACKRRNIKPRIARKG